MAKLNKLLFVMFVLTFVSSSYSGMIMDVESSLDNELNEDGDYALGCLGGGFTEEDRLSESESGLFSSSSSLPDIVDWRDYQDSNWVSPVRDQGYMGSCVAFGVLGALEPRLRVFYGDPDWGIDLSEQQVYEFGGGLPSGGMYISDALDYVELYGSPEEWCNPYNIPTLFDYTVNENWRLYTWKLYDWGWVSNDTESIKSALQDGPIVAAFSVYTDFFNYESGVYRHISGDYMGGHCVTIIGYNDVEGYWICKNSWGVDWGEEGYFRIAYGECGIEENVATFNVVDNRDANLWFTLNRIEAVDAFETIQEGEAEWEYYIQIEDGDDVFLDSGVVDSPYMQGGDAVTLNHDFRYKIDSDTVNLGIYLYERDQGTEFDVADISGEEGGGYDNYNGTYPEGAWYSGTYTISNHTLTGDHHEEENGWYYTSGVFDGSGEVDENDASIWFNLTTTPPTPEAQIKTLKERMLGAAPYTINFVKTGNIYDDSAFYAFYALKTNPQNTPHKTQSINNTDYNESGKPLFEGDIITFGGRLANRLVAYYEDQGYATIGYEWNGTHRIFKSLDSGDYIYPVPDQGYNSSEKDYFVFQIYSDGERYIASLWGFAAEGTYAGGTCFTDIIWPNIEEYTNSYYIYSWTDLNSDSMPQPQEIELEATGS